MGQDFLSIQSNIKVAMTFSVVQKGIRLKWVIVISSSFYKYEIVSNIIANITWG